MVLHRPIRADFLPEDILVPPMFSRDHDLSIPRLRLGQGELRPATAFQIVHDEAMLDGNSRLNLATFVSTWMEPEALQLYTETVDKNMIDKDEYPQTAAIEERCISILAKLWNAPDEVDPVGTSTIGSSEACMLAGMAFKRRWSNARKAAGKSTENPNLVMSSAVQVVWEKFCNYWEVEARYVPVTIDETNLTPRGMLDAIDENTIGVVGILGVTYTGSYEPIKELCAALDDLQQRTGQDVPLHVDAASGGMVAPFLQPDLEWDFRLSRVHSINTSGHKYGLVYPGIGWVMWRDHSCLPQELVFHVSYLGGDMPTLGLNFSRPGAQVLLQYYLFLRLGHDGYRRVQQACQDVALYLSDAIAKIPAFELLTKGDDIPVFAWRLKPGYTDLWTIDNLSNRLREFGWQVPAYPMPDNIASQRVMRIVVRNGFSMDLASLLMADIQASVKFFDSLDGPVPQDKNDSRDKSNGYSH